MSDNNRLEPCVPIDFDRQTLDEIVSKAKDWALMHGNPLFLFTISKSTVFINLFFY